MHHSAGGDIITSSRVVLRIRPNKICPATLSPGVYLFFVSHRPSVEDPVDDDDVKTPLGVHAPGVSSTSLALTDSLEPAAKKKRLQRAHGGKQAIFWRTVHRGVGWFVHFDYCGC